MPEVRKKDLLYPDLSYKIVGAAFSVYNALGSGHNEKYYQRALAEEFKSTGLSFKSEVHYPIQYKEKVIGRNFLDFLVEDKVIVETKKRNNFSTRHIAQVLEYLEISNLQLAIIINFGAQGVTYKRIINIK